MGDLERLTLVLDALPDEALMQLLEAGRGHGRNDYPIRPMWNSLIAGFVFQHPSIAALRRELLRNAQLRDRCGFDPFPGAAAVPSECAYTRFQRRLRKYQPLIEELFHSTLDELRIELPDLGQVQALDGKELHSLAKGESTYPLPKDKTSEDTDGRRDRDADWGVKGSGKKKHYWFRYLSHLVVDATYEVPLAFEVTKAATGEQPQAQRLLDQMQERHPELLHRCDRMSADKGYDDHKLIDRLWQQHQIKPVIAIRNRLTFTCRPRTMPAHRVPTLGHAPRSASTFRWRMIGPRLRLLIIVARPHVGERGSDSAKLRVERRDRDTW